MKNLIINIYMITCLILVTSTSLIAQDLKSQLEGKTTLEEIMSEVDALYAGQDDDWKGPDGSWPKLKHWKRWQWYQSGRLGPNGEFVDIKSRIRQENKKVERMAEESNTRDINPFWISEGPSSTGTGIGRADRIAFHPSNQNIFYVGTPAGGLWRTTNGGSSWTALTDHIPSIGISGIVVDWNDPSDIYILTGDGDSDQIGGFVDQFEYERRSIGVMRSLDGGVTWTQRGILDTVPFLPFKMAQSPINPGTMICATSIGIFHTTNYGATWTNTLNDNIFDVEFKPGTNRAYASSNGAIYYSTNGGETWQTSTLDVGLAGVQRTELAVTPSNSSRVYLFVGDTNGPGVFDGVYRSTNSGVSYTQRATTPNILDAATDGSGSGEQADYDHAMAVASDNSNIVVTGGVRIWKSTDGAGTFNYLGGTHADIHELAYNPLNDNLYACTDGGVYVSTDDGENWTALFDGFRTSQFYHMAGTLLDDEYFLGGLQDNGVKLKEGVGTTWTHVAGWDGFDVSFYPNDETRFYSTRNKQLFRHWNSGGNIAEITPPGGDSGANYDWFGTVRAHVSDPDIVIAGYDDIFVSDDNGDSWTNTGRTGTWALETCPSNSNRLYAAGASSFNVSSNGSLWRTDDLGDDGWTALHNNPGFPNPSTITKITDIAVSPTSSTNIMVTIGGFDDGLKVFRSINGGDTWFNWGGSLPNIPINCAVIGPGGLDFYIGTDLGVFYRGLGMSDWMPFSNAMPNVPVTELFLNSNDGNIYAATFGRGMWRTDQATNCPENLILGGSMTGNFHYEANNTITSTTNVDGGLGSSASFKAGTKVILAPGFIAERHTQFLAYIGGCGSGGIPEFLMEQPENPNTN